MSLNESRTIGCFSYGLVRESSRHEPDLGDFAGK